MARPEGTAVGGPRVTPADVLGFWFGAPPYAAREAWFRKSDAFDAEIRDTFGAAVALAIDGALPAPWHADTDARLAQLLLLDQFTRNAFRGSARAFAGDARAQALALAMLDRGEDRGLAPVQRWFVYLPLEHAEDLALQDRSVALFEALAAEHAPSADNVDYAERHRVIVRRFGRFPHRNAALGRDSTPDEIEFLKQPGSSF